MDVISNVLCLMRFDIDFYIQGHPVKIIMSISCFIIVFQAVFDNKRYISRCFEMLGTTYLQMFT